MLSKLLENPYIYRLWAGLMASVKLKVLQKEIENLGYKTIVDLGCGPAINTRLFADKRYIGIDINPKYIEYSKKRYPSATFLVADVAKDKYKLPHNPDLFVINSLLHHICEEETKLILNNVRQQLPKQGKVLIIENILPPEEKRIKHWLVLHDRGKFSKTYKDWKELFAQYFEIEKGYLFDAKLLYFFSIWELCLFVLKSSDNK
jgi:trans-aconitate methyltransferase